ncbi:MAG: translation initiation factor [Muribaculaceae bacterium]|nr:translation initiation factor [Muribaculaceae bacterium]
MTDNDWQAKLAALKASMPDSDTADDNDAAESSPEGNDGRQSQNTPLEIVFERKGRAGKCATIIAGFTIPQPEVDDIASRLKSSLGTGGSARAQEILIQGDRRSDVAAWLRAQGFKVKGVRQ